MRADQAEDCDLARCSLCGEPNQCALAADPGATECWCKTEIFPHGLLERVPENAVRRVCICQRCVENYHKENSG